MRKLYKKYTLTALFFMASGLITFSQQQVVKPNYRQIFGYNYEQAINYWNQEQWIDRRLLLSGIEPDFAKAIVFPELMRFSKLQNILEMQGLLALYVQYGENYANFSVGPFQMKPTFAEQIEKDVVRFNLPEYQKLPQLAGINSPSSRLSRVQRLNSNEWQVQYLIWFIRIMDLKYSHKTWYTIAEKLKFYATAYNTGYTKPETEIQKMITGKHFYISLFDNVHSYCYADIAEYFGNSNVTVSQNSQSGPVYKIN